MGREPDAEAAAGPELLTQALRWGLCAALAALATALICYPAWPGYTSYDSMLAYDEAAHGVTTAIWPPLHAYLFAVSRALGADLGGVFVFQTFALLLGAFVVIDALTRRAAVALVLCLAFLATFVWIPPQLGVVLAQWRDVTTTSFALLALGIWIASARSRSLAGVIAAAVLFGLAAALRYNSIALVAPPLTLMIWRPYLVGGASPPARIVAAVAVALSLAAALASTHWRLPDLRPLPPARNAVVTQEFDLIGISACASRTYLPPAMTLGQAITPAEVRQLYDPRHLNMSLGGPAAVALGKAPTSLQLERIKPTDPAAAEVGPLWRQAVAAEPACYLRHRLSVFREQMGLAGHVFYPVQGVMHPNAYGFALAHPKASAQVTAYVLGRAASPLQRAAWLYLLAVIGTAVVWLRGSPARGFLAAALAGAFLYALGLLVAGPGADARYIFPANTVCALVAIAGLGALISGRPRPPARP